jgi:hypothetical protein
MIDKKTAIQLAMDAGFEFWTGEHDYYQCTDEQIQSLITRAMHEAYERAAKECETLSDCANHFVDINGLVCAASIRSLKQVPPK